VTLITVLLCAAPVPGDIGSCGQPVALLDAGIFLRSKKHNDCEKCTACHFDTATCRAACDGTSPGASFPPGCEPLVHDGEVCLRRLLDASCDDYEAWIGDPPSVPTECDFCPR
jgi:hypothetical protein